MWFSPEISSTLDSEFYNAFWSAISNLGEAINTESRLCPDSPLHARRIKVRPVVGSLNGNCGQLFVRVWTMGLVGADPVPISDFRLDFELFDEECEELSMRGKFKHFCTPGGVAYSSRDIFIRVTQAPTQA